MKLYKLNDNEKSLHVLVKVYNTEVFLDLRHKNYKLTKLQKLKITNLVKKIVWQDTVVNYERVSYYMLFCLKILTIIILYLQRYCNLHD